MIPFKTMECKIKHCNKHTYTLFLAQLHFRAESLLRWEAFTAAAKAQHRIYESPNCNLQSRNGNTLCSEEAPVQSPFAVDSYTYYYLLQACTSIQSVQQVHAQMLASGLDQSACLSAKLLSMYAMSGHMENAGLVFNKIHHKNAFIWNAMIRWHARNGLCEEALILYCRMQQTGIQPDKFTFSFVLKACADLAALQEGKEIHNSLLRSGFESDVFVGNCLVVMYAKCGVLQIARHVFDKMSTKDVVSWNAMIAGYVQNGHADEALMLVDQMQLTDIEPDTITMVHALQACAQAGALEKGKWVHDYVVRSGYEWDCFVGNSLIDMYAKCRNIEIARQFFDKMSGRNVVSWTSMIAGYAHNGHADKALTLFSQMLLEGVTPNLVTVVSVLQACSHSGALQQGKLFHAYIIKGGFEPDVFVGNSLVGMYINCGDLEIARQLFEKMPNRNVVSWNAMIAGYAQSGYANEALILYNQMPLENIQPNAVTVVNLLRAFVHLAALQQGKQIHGYIIKCGFESNVFVGNSLIGMYAKCGSIEFASQFFHKMSTKDVVSWSAMIAGYGNHGHPHEALEIFYQMQEAGMRPNHITFVCVLSACSHAGLLDEGWQYFHCMVKDYCITPWMEHYACMVDLLGRAGCLCEARDFIGKMPLEPGASVWGALLSACRIHCNIDLGKHVAAHLFDLEPENVGCYILLSNIYAAAGKWDDAAKVRKMMKDRGLKKTPACSLIEVDSRVHAFFVGDTSHPQYDNIYAMLETLTGQMEEAGYMPNRNFVLYDVEEEVREHVLCDHSRKLAIAFELINTIPGSMVRITKSLSE